MATRPNFTTVQLSGNKVTAVGESNSDDLSDLIGIQVFVRQEATAAGGQATLATGFAPQAGSTWEAEFDANGLTAGPALADGSENHSDPMTTIWWVEQVEIEE
jgi:hypothetical protein